MKSQEIRKQFIDFFKDKGHAFVQSGSVVPLDDPTLLFTNAGMNQFKPIFLNEEEPKFKRVANSQKCIRVSGKHNDLEEVGVDNYHHTFFEMLGNWSFGDYYKEDAIQWAWELLTEVWKLEKERLWVTIFQDDDEAGDIWKQVTDISADRVLKYGHKDNFWEMGETGPCGPCTEIHYYTGENIEDQTSSGVNDLPEYREIWNLVFIQYNRKADGSLIDLPEKHVDTGAGFERIVAVLNGFESNYETDLFQPIIKKIVETTGKPYDFENGVPHQVIADHLRMLSFSIADGALPGNVGRGYVLRRVLRRASRFGRLLDMHQPFIFLLVNTLVDVMGDAFPELKEKKVHIEKVISAEESSFGETLDRGLEIFSKIISGKKPGDQIPGDDAFKLYDTYGFPIDLTELMAREKELSVDSVEFEKCMDIQRERARSSGKFSANLAKKEWTIVSDCDNSDFLGYEMLEATGKIHKFRQSGKIAEVVLNKTPFYAESGGQMGDTGNMLAENFELKVLDTVRSGEEIIHIGEIVNGDIAAVKEVTAVVMGDRRQQLRLNHTATHLMHEALRQVLGEHVQQAGSLVAPERLRFDLTHYEQINEKDISQIESIVNDKIRDNIILETELMEFEAARKSGAAALFGEKYGDEVRVVSIPGFSKELCGGTHVDRTGDIGGFKIISETALSSGVRRIEAITGRAIVNYLNDQQIMIQEVKGMLKCADDEVVQRLKGVLSDKKALEKELKQSQQVSQGDLVKEMVAAAEVNGHLKIIINILENVSDLKDMGDSFRQYLKTDGIALIGTVSSGKPMVMCAVTDNLTNSLKAGDVVREVGEHMGGGGGGKPHLATAGGKESSKLSEAMDKGKLLIEKTLGI